MSDDTKFNFGFYDSEDSTTASNRLANEVIDGARTRVNAEIAARIANGTAAAAGLAASSRLLGSLEIIGMNAAKTESSIRMKAHGHNFGEASSVSASSTRLGGPEMIKGAENAQPREAAKSAVKESATKAVENAYLQHGKDLRKPESY